MTSIARSCGREESPDNAPLGGSFIEKGRSEDNVDAFIFGEVEAVPEVPGIRPDIISLRCIRIAKVRSSRGAMVSADSWPMLAAAPRAPLMASIERSYGRGGPPNNTPLGGSFRGGSSARSSLYTAGYHFVEMHSDSRSTILPGIHGLGGFSFHKE
jgi:hypothetical protein